MRKKQLIHNPVLAAAMMVVAWGALPVEAQRTEQMPAALQEVGITEYLDVQLPMDLQFVTAQGRAVRLGDYFSGDKPVLLTLNYYGCPMLCTLQLNGLIAGLQPMEWLAGEQFEIVTVSIDPTETQTLARAKKRSYLTELDRPGAEKGWHFLLSPDESQVKQLAERVGFGYQYDPETDQYAHAAAAFVCTPDGRVSRYLYGVEFDPQTLRLSLVEAGQGKIGSTMDQVLLFCFHYDAALGSYGLAAMNLMRAGGILIVLVIVVGIIVMRRHRGSGPANSSTGEELQPS